MTKYMTKNPKYLLPYDQNWAYVSLSSLIQKAHYHQYIHDLVCQAQNKWKQKQNKSEKYVSKWVIECVKELVREWVNEWKSEWENEWNEWVSELQSEWVS